MISALLLPLFLAGTPVSIGGTPSGDPPIQLWINNDGRFLPGDRAKVQVRTKDDGYLLVLHADPDGHLRVLFPLDPDDDNFVRGGKRYDVEGRGGREAFGIDGTSGRGMVYAAVSRNPFRFDGYLRGDHWDYRALAPSRLPREPESELTDLVRSMTQGDFDYDVLTYDVIERVVYASDYSSAPSSFSVPSLSDPWCSGFSSGFGCARPFSGSRFGVSAHFFFGPPFRRFDSPFLFPFDPFFHREVFFDPFVFDPFFRRPFFSSRFGVSAFLFFGRPFRRFDSPFLFAFDPFFDPFFHRGFFFDPFVFDPFFHRPFFHQPVFVGGFFHRPFFFRPRDGAPVPFRDRRNDFRRAMNTADLTPWRARGAATASRGRRVVEFRSEGPVRRTVADARQPAEWRTIEARRAREPERAPARREPATEARRDNWPVDVSPRRRDLDPPTARRAEDDRLAEVRPQIDRTPLPEARRARRIEDRPGLEMAPPDRGGRESYSPVPDQGRDRGSWSLPSDRGGDRGFAPSAPRSDGGGRGGSRRR